MATSPDTTRRDLLVVAAVCTLLLAPFLGRAFNIDDPLFIWGARQIAAHPLDPYGFAGNWNGMRQPFYKFMQNPPLASYYLALFGRVIGWGEVAMHAAMLPVTIAAAIGTYLVAAEYCRRPLAATLLVVACPAFVVSATTVMCELPLLCLWVWSVAFWVRGSAADRPTLLAASAVTAAAAVLTKYPGIDLVPLLAAHAVLCPAARWRTRIVQAVCLLLPVATLVAWEYGSAARYGVALVSDAIAFSRRTNHAYALPPVAKSLDTLAFVGGVALPAAAAAVVGVARGARPSSTVIRLLGLTALAAALAVAAAHLCPTGTWSRKAGTPAGWFPSFGLLAAGGVVTLAACVAGLGSAGADRRRGLFLLAWVAGVFVFAAVLNWSVNARSLLPMLPPAAILLVRAVDAHRPGRSTSPLVWTTAMAAAVSVWLAVDDTRVAGVNRDAAIRIADRLAPGPGRRLWFGGHWGFQYYIEPRGAVPLDLDGPPPAVGDYVALPLDNYGQIKLPPHTRNLVRIEAGDGYWTSTNNDPCGAGFYASFGDRLPFVFGRIPPESFSVSRVEP